MTEPAVGMVDGGQHAETARIASVGALSGKPITYRASARVRIPLSRARTPGAATAFSQAIHFAFGFFQSVAEFGLPAFLQGQRNAAFFHRQGNAEGAANLGNLETVG